MPNRTPSFIVVGLVIIMFLLGFFYMSCSSTTGELRQTLTEFEERIRALTIKNDENEKKLETLNTNKRELEEEKLNIQKLMEKKDSEINDLNTKLNIKHSELQTLQSDKQVLEQQLKEYKNLSDIALSQSFTNDKIRQEYDKQLNDLKQQIEQYKQKINQSQEKVPVISNQRFQPLLSSNETNSLSQQFSTNISNNIGNNSISNQVNNTQQFDRNQLARDLAGQGQNNSDVHQRLQRSLNDSLLVNKIQLNIENAQKPVNLTSILSVNETNIVNNQSQLLPDNQNKNEQLQIAKNEIKSNNGEPVELH